MSAKDRFGIARLLALIAGAWVAFSTDAEAAIVHVVPPEPITITNDFFFDPFLLDLDGDSVGDVAFNHRGIETTATPTSEARLLSDSIDSDLAAALPDGSFVGLDADNPLTWTPNIQVLSACVSAGGIVCLGNFRGGRDYLGVEFDISGQTHYGWVQIQSVDLAVFARIIDWAYESEPGVGIFAGQIPEPSASLLALCGLAAILSRRRRASRP